MDPAQLRNADAFLELVERTAFVGVWMIDLEHDRLLWSNQLATLHGAQPGFVPPVEEAFSFYAPEWREQVTALFAACARDGIPFDGMAGRVISIRAVSGRNCPLASSATDQIELGSVPL